MLSLDEGIERAPAARVVVRHDKRAGRAQRLALVVQLVHERVAVRRARDLRANRRQVVDGEARGRHRRGGPI
jgi:hypothetical protein